MPEPCPYYAHVKIGDKTCRRMKAENRTSLCVDCQLYAEEGMQTRVSASRRKETKKMASKKGEFKCKKCGVVFVTQNGLSRHMGWCGKSKEERSEYSKSLKARKKARPARVASPKKPKRIKRRETARGPTLVEIFQLEDYRIRINPDAGLDDLIALRNEIEEAIQGKFKG